MHTATQMTATLRGREVADAVAVSLSRFVGFSEAQQVGVRERDARGQQ